MRWYMYVEEYQNNLTESFNEYSIVLILFNIHIPSHCIIELIF